MKIAAYTIALNEIKHCERWAESVKDADYRVVLDTGSTDGTVEKLRELGVMVFEHKFDPWRFDHSRNMALACVPDDAEVCISLDMDVFMGPGWRAGIEKDWVPGVTTRFNYTYHFDFRPEGPNLNGYRMDKIHHRIGYQWKRPVHENVWCTVDKEVIATNMDVQLNQMQDRSKPTRNNYLPLMKMATIEDPDDSQMSFWYGRELMYAGERDNAIAELERFLTIKSTLWHIERSEAMTYIARMNETKSEYYLLWATATSPTRREVWLDVAAYYYSKEDWNSLLWAASNGINRSERHGSYLDRADAWGHQLYDLGSLAATNLEWWSKAVEWCTKAIEMQPNEERLRNNLQFMQDKLTETTK